MPISIAIIGAGKIAQDQHIPSILNSADFTLACVIDPSIALSEFPSFKSLDDALAAGIHIDAVAICTPPQIRRKLAEEALKHGLHVLLEKPPVQKSADMAAIQKLAEENNLTVFTAWHSRFAPCVAQAKTWAKRRDIASAQIEWRENVHKWHPGQNWLWQDGGMGVFDPGINALSILTDIIPSAWRLTKAEMDIPSNQAMPIKADIKMISETCRLDGHFDFLEAVGEIWQFTFWAMDGDKLQIYQGGHALSLNDGPVQAGEQAEYPALYTRFANLIQSGKSEIDLRPLILVEEIFEKAKRSSVAAFDP